MAARILDLFGRVTVTFRIRDLWWTNSDGATEINDLKSKIKNELRYFKKLRKDHRGFKRKFN